MDRKGGCSDQAVAESCVGSVKSEQIHRRGDQTRQEAPADVTLFDNVRRLQSYLGHHTPYGYERNRRVADAP